MLHKQKTKIATVVISWRRILHLSIEQTIEQHLLTFILIDASHVERRVFDTTFSYFRLRILFARPFVTYCHLCDNLSVIRCR